MSAPAPHTPHTDQASASTAIAAGIDLGGTKIETQVFDQHWQVIARQRVATPTDYNKLLDALAAQIHWADQQVDAIAATTLPTLPVGVGVPGLIHPETGIAVTANICATGRALPADLEVLAGRRISFLNDCRATALSEVKFGAGREYRTVLALILGTGIGGGVAVDGELLFGATLTGGEFGHLGAPAGLLNKHQLPLVNCGCGAMACIENYVSGTGMSRIAESLTGTPVAPHEIATKRHSDEKLAKVWDVWCELAGDFLRTLTLTVDPDVIVLAGGLSNINGIVEELSVAGNKAQIADFSIPPIVLAQGGDSSGARGAAWQSLRDAEAPGERPAQGCNADPEAGTSTNGVTAS